MIRLEAGKGVKSNVRASFCKASGNAFIASCFSLIFRCRSPACLAARRLYSTLYL